MHIKAFYILLMTVVVEVYAESRKLQLKRTSGVLYSNNFATLETLSDIACVDVCINTRLCLSANYNPGTRTCALINDLQVFVTDVNWHAYSVITDTRVPVASATQSTTYVHLGKALTASLALDGNFDTSVGSMSCALTSISTDNFWQAELSEYSTVRRVALYMRSDCCSERNSHLTVTVCQTESECAQNAGAVCVIYPGPPVDPTLSIMLFCETTLHGNFVRIRHQYPGGTQLQLCEAAVYYH